MHCTERSYGLPELADNYTEAEKRVYQQDRWNYARRVLPEYFEHPNCILAHECRRPLNAKLEAVMTYFHFCVWKRREC